MLFLHRKRKWKSFEPITRFPLFRCRKLAFKCFVERKKQHKDGLYKTFLKLFFPCGCWAFVWLRVLRGCSVVCYPSKKKFPRTANSWNVSKRLRLSFYFCRDGKKIYAINARAAFKLIWVTCPHRGILSSKLKAAYNRSESRLFPLASKRRKQDRPGWEKLEKIAQASWPEISKNVNVGFVACLLSSSTLFLFPPLPTFNRRPSPPSLPFPSLFLLYPRPIFPRPFGIKDPKMLRKEERKPRKDGGFWCIWRRELR